MAFGLGNLKKLARQGGSIALKAGVNAATGGIGMEIVGTALKTVKDERVDQVRDALIGTVAKGKLANFAKLAEDALELKHIVQAARANGNISQDEIEAILKAVEEMGDNAKKAMASIVG